MGTFKIAKKLYEAQNYQGALKKFQQVVAKHKDDPEAWWYIGQCYRNIQPNNLPAALKAFTRSIAAKEDYFSSYQGRGVTYFAMGKYKEAIRDLTNAVVISQPVARYYPPYSSYYYRAYSYHLLGQNDKALADIQQSLKLKPTYPSSKPLKEKIVAAKKIADAKQKEAEESFKQAVTLSTQQNYVSALEKFNQLLVTHSQRKMDILLQRAVCFLNLNREGDLERALGDLNRIIKALPKNPYGYYYRGKIYELRGNQDEALANYKLANSLALPTKAMGALAQTAISNVSARQPKLKGPINAGGFLTANLTIIPARGRGIAVSQNSNGFFQGSYGGGSPKDVARQMKADAKALAKDVTKGVKKLGKAGKKGVKGFKKAIKEITGIKL